MNDVDAADVVYLLLVHDQPAHLARLVDRLSTPGARFVIHVDAHRDDQPFLDLLGHRADVVFVAERVPVRWAAWSQVDSTLRAMRLALDRWGRSPSHHVLLSGGDYPLRPAARIVDQLASRRGEQFIRRFDVLRHGDRRQRSRVLGRHLRQLADRHTVWRKPLKALELLLSLVPRRIPEGLRMMAGSNWWALTPDCSAWCLRVVEERPAWRRLFRSTFAPDEMFFHTLVENSRWEATARASEPYYEVTEIGGPWRYGNLHYLHPIEPITTLASLEASLDRPEILFARKFSEIHSAEVLDLIDRTLLASPPR